MAHSYFFTFLVTTSMFGLLFMFLFTENYFLTYTTCCNSMYPAINNGVHGNDTCILLERATNGKNLTNGTIVNYKYGGDYNILHRIIDTCSTPIEYGINETDKSIYPTDFQYGYIIQGDNNDYEDGCIPEWAIRHELIVSMCKEDLRQGRVLPVFHDC